MSDIREREDGAKFVAYTDDPPSIDVMGEDKYFDARNMEQMKGYFDANLACGDLAKDINDGFYPQNRIRGGAPVWVSDRDGCGSRDWTVKPAFWYPRPGRQFEITCNCCKRMFGVEVRVPVVEARS